MAKSIPEVKIGNEVYQIKDRTAREHLIEVKQGNTPPESADNRLWIKDQENEYEVPTIDEHNELKSAFTSFIDYGHIYKSRDNLFNGLYYTDFAISGEPPTINKSAGKVTAIIECEVGKSYTITKKAKYNSTYTRFRIFESDSIEAGAHPTLLYGTNTSSTYTTPALTKKYLIINVDNFTGGTPIPEYMPTELKVEVSTADPAIRNYIPFSDIMRKADVNGMGIYATPWNVKIVAPSSARIVTPSGNKRLSGSDISQNFTITDIRTFYTENNVQTMHIVLEIAYSSGNYTATMSLATASTLTDKLESGAYWLGSLFYNPVSDEVEYVTFSIKYRWINDEARCGLIDAKSYLSDPSATDISQELQKIIYIANEFGTGVFLRNGTYRIQRTIYLPPSTSLIGESKDAIIQQYNIKEGSSLVSYEAGEPVAAADRANDTVIRAAIDAASSGTLYSEFWRDESGYENRMYHSPLIKVGIRDTICNCEVRNITLRGRFYNVDMSGEDDWTDKIQIDGILVQGYGNKVSNIIITTINYEPLLFNQSVNSWATPAGGSGTNNAPAWGLAIREAYRSYFKDIYVTRCGYQCVGVENSSYIFIDNIICTAASRTAFQVHKSVSDLYVDRFYFNAYEGLPSSYDTSPGYAHNEYSLAADISTGGMTIHVNNIANAGARKVFSNGTLPYVQEVTGYSSGASFVNCVFTKKYLMVQNTNSDTPIYKAMYFFNHCKITSDANVDLLTFTVRKNSQGVNAGYASIKALIISKCIDSNHPLEKYGIFTRYLGTQYRVVDPICLVENAGGEPVYP